MHRHCCEGYRELLKSDVAEAGDKYFVETKMEHQVVIGNLKRD